MRARSCRPAKARSLFISRSICCTAGRMASIFDRIEDFLCHSRCHVQYFRDSSRSPARGGSRETTNTTGWLVPPHLAAADPAAGSRLEKVNSYRVSSLSSIYSAVGSFGILVVKSFYCDVYSPPLPRPFFVCLFFKFDFAKSRRFGARVLFALLHPISPSIHPRHLSPGDSH